MVGTGIPGKRWKLVGKRAEDREGHQGPLKLTEVLHSSRTLLTYLPGSSSSEVLCKRGPSGFTCIWDFAWLGSRKKAGKKGGTVGKVQMQGKQGGSVAPGKYLSLSLRTHLVPGTCTGEGES